jgi:hypothetical protein
MIFPWKELYRRLTVQSVSNIVIDKAPSHTDIEQYSDSKILPKNGH